MIVDNEESNVDRMDDNISNGGELYDHIDCEIGVFGLVIQIVVDQDSSCIRLQIFSSHVFDFILLILQVCRIGLIKQN